MMPTIYGPSAAPRIDASHLWGPVWQGSWPGEGVAVSLAGFDGLALCAWERQPERGSFPGVRVVVRVKLDDKDIDAETWKMAADASRAIAGHIERREAEKFLVTCNLGLNRSGIVSAMLIHRLSGKPGRECVAIVRRRRSGALCNESFARAVARRL